MEKKENTCRVCLIPEDKNEKFLSLFANNAVAAALKIFKLTGIVILDINGTNPSVICKKCVEDIEIAEKLRMRILDADEFYSTMTADKDKRFLEVEIRSMKSRKRKVLPPTNGRKINQKLKLKNLENVKPRKRKMQVDHERSGNDRSKNDKSNQGSNQSFTSNATPKKLGIHRKIVKKKKK